MLTRTSTTGDLPDHLGGFHPPVPHLLLPAAASHRSSKMNSQDIAELRRVADLHKDVAERLRAIADKEERALKSAREYETRSRQRKNPNVPPKK